MKRTMQLFSLLLVVLQQVIFYHVQLPGMLFLHKFVQEDKFTEVYFVFAHRQACERSGRALPNTLLHDHFLRT